MTFADYNQIVRRLYEYALGIDTRDWVLFRSIFTDEITTDFSSYNGQRAAKTTADDWVAGCRVLFTGLDASQHVMSNPMVNADGERARCRMYMKAEHFLINDQGDDEFALGGYYDDTLVKTSEGWRIETVTLTVFWNRGNRQIMDMAMRKGQERLKESA